MEAFLITGLLILEAAIIAVLVLKRRPASPAASAPGPPVVADAEPQRLEAEQLCNFIGVTTKLDPHRKPGPQLAPLVQSLFEVESVAIFDADIEEVYRAGEWFDDLPDILRNICTFETVSDDPETGLSRRVLRMGDLPIGALLLRGETRDRMASAIASIVAITFDRYHAFANESRTESARQAEQLRTTAGHRSLRSEVKRLVALITEQTALLNRLTNRLLRTARLQASDMIPHAEKVAIAPLIEDVVASLRDQLAGFPVKIAISRDDLSLRCDRSLLTALLTQYVDNAAKYGTAGTPVTIEAAERAAEVIFSVHSLGPAIPAADFERIFDRFYRSSTLANKAPGTGIGLSVAKRTAQAQGGHVWVTSDADKGTTFYASLPTIPPSAVAQGGARK